MDEGRGIYSVAMFQNPNNKCHRRFAGGIYRMGPLFHQTRKEKS